MATRKSEVDNPFKGLNEANQLVRAGIGKADEALDVGSVPSILCPPSKTETEKRGGVELSLKSPVDGHRTSREEMQPEPSEHLRAWARRVARL
jgi:hypothetical protein